jgi:hypothetical protein
LYKASSILGPQMLPGFLSFYLEMP